MNRYLILVTMMQSKTKTSYLQYRKFISVTLKSQNRKRISLIKNDSPPATIYVTKRAKSPKKLCRISQFLNFSDSTNPTDTTRPASLKSEFSGPEATLNTYLILFTLHHSDSEHPQTSAWQTERERNTCQLPPNKLRTIPKSKLFPIEIRGSCTLWAQYKTF